MKANYFITILLCCICGNASGQGEARFRLNEDGRHYFKFSLLSQAWLRYANLNQGSLVYGNEKKSVTDIGIRRARLQAFGKIADRVFIYAQFGMNNFNYLSERKTGFFIHDIHGEYEVINNKLSLGMGLTGWSGLTRFASPSAGSILGVDAPLFEQNTNDVTDQFLRKLSVFAKGKLGKLDYRVLMSSPMAVQRSSGYVSTPTLYSNFSALPPEMQWQGYFQYQFLDQESNVTAYTTGTYLGTKKIFNIGAGFQVQPEAMWRLEQGDTTFSALKNFAADFFYDAPIGTGGNAFNFYGAYVYSDFGNGYSRNLAPMNPANGSNNPQILNGSGTGFPAFGTGHIVYGQLGYKTKNNLVGTTSFLPYVSLQWADYDRLKENMLFWDAGISWLLKNHAAKLTAAYQSRPVYQQLPNEFEATKTDRKGAYILQFQVLLN
ncbi:MAG: hypothetical protein H0U44_03455 [Flavisolibacter sp.]|nr:hypothetical protein [Flavisolibacter sp.]